MIYKKSILRLLIFSFLFTSKVFLSAKKPLPVKNEERKYYRTCVLVDGQEVNFSSSRKVQKNLNSKKIGLTTAFS